MSSVTTRGIVSIALAANAIIAGGTILAYASTGSSALLSAAILSLVGIAHQSLLLFGLTNAARPGDARHPFGHAREIYFWSFAAAILLYSHGAGVTIFEGVQKLKTPPFLSISPICYVVLIGGLFLVAGLVAAWLKWGPRSPDAHTTLPADPALAAIVVGGIAAGAGLLLALAGVTATDVFAWRPGDAMATLGIGFVMAAVAAFMSLKTKSLIVGEAARAGLRSAVRAALQMEVAPGRPLKAIHDVRTLRLGPDDVLVAASVQFVGAETVHGVESTTRRLVRAIKAEDDEIRHVYITAHRPQLDENIAEDFEAEEPEPPMAEETVSVGSIVATGLANTEDAGGSPRPVHPNDSHKTRKKKRRH